MVIKEIVMDRISHELPAELVRRPEERNMHRHELRTLHVCDAAKLSSSLQNVDILRDALGLWGIDAEDGLRYERRLRREW
ncbi:hypothetical protein SMZ97_004207 [Cronobacter turicensis]|nr:hypothetical protein [Cronobacter turicensis]